MSSKLIDKENNMILERKLEMAFKKIDQLQKENRELKSKRKGDRAEIKKYVDFEADVNLERCIKISIGLRNRYHRNNLKLNSWKNEMLSK